MQAVWGCDPTGHADRGTAGTLEGRRRLSRVSPLEYSIRGCLKKILHDGVRDGILGTGNSDEADVDPREVAFTQFSRQVIHRLGTNLRIDVVGLLLYARNRARVVATGARGVRLHGSGSSYTAPN